MNNLRRKEIEKIRIKINNILEAAEKIKEEVEVIRDEEQEYLNNIPFYLAQGEKAVQAKATIQALEEIIEELDGFNDSNFDEKLDISIQ